MPLDSGWRFALGNATDRNADFNFNTGYFSYLAKTGYGDGAAAAAPLFDDRGWRKVDLPHDWGVEMPFAQEASRSHGHKAFGPGFPETSVGWYRNAFTVSEADLGQKIYIEVDAAFRDSMVFINGFFVGREPSGYLGFRYDISDYLNYGGNNTVVVRVDASTEEGWYYEGAGLYRHVRLEKLNPVHLDPDGLWAYTESILQTDSGIRADIEVSCDTLNTTAEDVLIEVHQSILDAAGNIVKTLAPATVEVPAGGSVEHTAHVVLNNAALWNLDQPNLYTLKTELFRSGELIDTRSAPFGVRTAVFDPDKGFLLNGEVVKLKGVNLHQDHAGVGVAVPDELAEWRVRKLKEMGINGIRTAHQPAPQALLDICDRLGMVIVDENRLMGINDFHLDQLKRMMRAHRTHPSVIIWSIGNEEWAIEGNIKGARIAQTMQDFAHRIDPSRPCTAAISGGWGGTSSVTDVLGVNYVLQGHPDRQHIEYPWQPQFGSEESTTNATRGVYVTDEAKAHLAPAKRADGSDATEFGWQFYAERPHTSGIFYWTGFDYRGEPTPFSFPGVLSQFGILDLCGFPKDSAYYLRSQWSPVDELFISPHWNWAGHEGEPQEVRVYGNFDSVELFLNGTSLGTKEMPLRGHLEWSVPYSPGELKAVAYRDGSPVMETTRVTAGEAASMALAHDVVPAHPGGKNLHVVNISLLDKSGNINPLADNTLAFTVSGDARIIGVGNGDPSSLDPEVFVPTVRTQIIGNWQMPDPANPGPEVVFEAAFDAPADPAATVSLLLNSLGKVQSAYLNGNPVYVDVSADTARIELPLNASNMKPTGNVLRLVATPIDNRWDRERDWKAVVPAMLRIETPAPQWTRKAFNGLAQVILQSTGPASLTVTSEGLPEATLTLE